jgi:hypothetical protein
MGAACFNCNAPVARRNDAVARDGHRDVLQRMRRATMNSTSQFADPGPQPRGIDLDDEQMLVLGSQPGARLRVLSGALWLTAPGHSVARMIRQHEAADLTVDGEVIIEAAGPSRIEIARPRRAWVHGLEDIGRPRQFAQALALMIAVAVGAGLPDLLAREFQKSAGDAMLAAAAPQAAPARL